MHSVGGTSGKSFIGTVGTRTRPKRKTKRESPGEVKAEKERNEKEEKREGGRRVEINKDDSAKEGEKIITSIVRGPHVVRAVASRHAAFRAKRGASVRVRGPRGRGASFPNRGHPSLTTPFLIPVSLPVHCRYYVRRILTRP